MQSISVIADTSFVVARLNRKDKHHAAASKFYNVTQNEVILPSVVLTEVAYLAAQIGGGNLVASVIDTLCKSPYVITELTDADYALTGEILRKYHDTRIDFVDASIMALSERLNIQRILTFDHRDFRLYRPSHVEAFTLLP